MSTHQSVNQSDAKSWDLAQPMGPSPRTLTPVQWLERLRSFVYVKPETTRMPRMKKPKLTHQLNAETKKCDVCGKRARSATAICSGPAETVQPS